MTTQIQFDISVKGVAKATRNKIQKEHFRDLSHVLTYRHVWNPQDGETVAQRRLTTGETGEQVTGAGRKLRASGGPVENGNKQCVGGV